MTDPCGASGSAPFLPLINRQEEAKIVAQDRLANTSAQHAFPRSQDSKATEKQTEFDAFGRKMAELPSPDTLNLGETSPAPLLRNETAMNLAWGRGKTHNNESRLEQSSLVLDPRIRAIHNKLEKTFKEAADKANEKSEPFGGFFTDEALEKKMESDEEYKDFNERGKLNIRMNNLEEQGRDGVETFLDKVIPEWKKLSKRGRSYVLGSSLRRSLNDVNDDGGYLRKLEPSDRDPFEEIVTKMQQPEEREILGKALYRLASKNLPEGIIKSDLYQFLISVYKREKANELPPPELLVKAKL